MVSRLVGMKGQLREIFLISDTAIYSCSQADIFLHSFSILSDDRSKASSKTIPPHSAI